MVVHAGMEFHKHALALKKFYKRLFLPFLDEAYINFLLAESIHSIIHDDMKKCFKNPQLISEEMLFKKGKSIQNIMHALK